MTWIVRRTITAVLLFVLLMFALRRLGNPQQNPAASVLELDPEQVAQSCWHHICPGRTTFTELIAVLRTETNRAKDIRVQTYPGSTNASICWTDSVLLQATVCAEQFEPRGDQIIDYLQIGPLGNDFPVNLGDVVALLGSPTATNLCLSRLTVLQNALVAINTTLFDDGKVVVTSYSPGHPLAWQVDPIQTVLYIEFRKRPIPILEGPTWKWRGFVTGPAGPVICFG